MTNNINLYDLKINPDLYNFINKDVLPGTDIEELSFWKGFSDLIYKFNPINKNLIKKRKSLQDQINKWHNDHRGKKYNIDDYEKFLINIGYLIPEGSDFEIDTQNVDPEIAEISGPQLVVPITNARYALNAANARWGSLYDAIYGTDVLGSLPRDDKYNFERGQKVIDFVKSHLDIFAPLCKSQWKNVCEFIIEDNSIKFILKDGSITFLSDKKQVVGFNFNKDKKISELILKKNNLHCRIFINSNNLIGKNDIANISDVILESAISVIMDCEDSVSTVDSDDKILAYRNWLGLMKGDLIAKFSKKNEIVQRKLNNDINFLDFSNNKIILKSRALMLVRNVGHLMTTQAILDNQDMEIGEGLMDAMITSLIAIHDLKKITDKRNSSCGSVYIVKPKMHGPEEVLFTNNLFAYVEKILKLPINTLKIGIMDEERRTSVNLKECIRAAKSRVAFINTGFLDRTGDEIHTSMMAGPFLKKSDMKNTTWIKSYEERNVNIGLNCGLQGKAQIGKGMWAMPDLMSLMIEQKINHPMSGANCAWVPSPTAATLHATHYHKIDVVDVQNDIIKNKKRNALKNLLTIPLLSGKNLSELEIESEIENNAQSILGYVVRWVNQGIGCSKVLDINNIGLMEDRATCRISSQAITNWLTHKIVSEEQVMSIMKKMAKIVDNQNKNDLDYLPMAKTYETIAFKAACDLVFKGIDQPSGYTEPILHKRRIELKKI